MNTMVATKASDTRLVRPTLARVDQSGRLSVGDDVLPTDQGHGDDGDRGRKGRDRGDRVHLFTARVEGAKQDGAKHCGEGCTPGSRRCSHETTVRLRPEEIRRV